MKKFSAVLCLAAATVGAVPALAQSISSKGGVITTTRTEVRGKQIDKITCREFLSLRTRLQPQVLSYTVGYNKAKKPDDVVFNVEDVDRLTPVVVRSCKTRPEESLMQRIRALWNKL